MEMASNRPGTPVLWCLAAAALFGASTPASKWLLDAQVGPLTLAGLLYLGAALATAPFAFRGGSPQRRREPENLRRLGGAILFGGILGPVALLLGLREAPAASVALWLNLETTATAVLAWAFFREHMRGRDWGANLLVVLAGVLLAAPDGFSFAPAALLVVVACTCWGLDNNFTALIDGYTPAQTTLAKGVVAGTFNLALGLFFEGSDLGVGVFALALVIGAAAYGFSIVLYIAGAQQLGASRSQMLFATAPFVGTTIAWPSCPSRFSPCRLPREAGSSWPWESCLPGSTGIGIAIRPNGIPIPTGTTMGITITPTKVALRMPGTPTSTSTRKWNTATRTNPISTIATTTTEAPDLSSRERRRGQGVWVLSL